MVDLKYTELQGTSLAIIEKCSQFFEMIVKSYLSILIQLTFLIYEKDIALLIPIELHGV